MNSVNRAFKDRWTLSLTDYRYLCGYLIPQFYSHPAALTFSAVRRDAILAKGRRKIRYRDPPKGSAHQYVAESDYSPTLSLIGFPAAYLLV